MSVIYIYQCELSVSCQSSVSVIYIYPYQLTTSCNNGEFHFCRFRSIFWSNNSSENVPALRAHIETAEESQCLHRHRVGTGKWECWCLINANEINESHMTCQQTCGFVIKVSQRIHVYGNSCLCI